MTENRNGPASIIHELNAITLGAIREFADCAEGDHLLSIKFGISKRTADAVRKLHIDDLWRIVDHLGDTYLFAAKNADDTLYQLIRSGVADKDVFVLAKLRTIAAAKAGS